MMDNPLSRIPWFDRLSIRAVVTSGEDGASAALSEAGIFDPVTLPLVLGPQPGTGLGDGITQNLTAVLQFDPDAAGLDAASRVAVSGPGPAGEDRSVPTSLPAAYGLQPTAPVRKRVL